MHMADALVSPEVAGVAGAVSLAALVVATKKVKTRNDDSLVPLMGVMGAFVFAAQMINFTIPGTGSSGHIVGGVLLGALLGPWAAFITLASVLVVQCLVFADGGLMALGCNILNMGICSTLIAYPLIFRPIAGRCDKSWRLIVASVVASVAGLELGALLVTAETEASGVTALPFGQFFTLMTTIHLLIGIGEGVATAVVLYFVKSYRPSLLNVSIRKERHSSGKVLAILGGVAAVLAATFSWIASAHPDGLEWSIERITGSTELDGTGSGIATALEKAQMATAVLPDYDSTWSGIIGCIIVVAMVWVICSLVVRRKSRNA